ncbi:MULTISPECIES: hypothetical protein [Flavobacteriaceae]|uniref:hypothetical protein n=1 Tax=Flavobacteriaceae TaxID=49546 RepID=UPI00234B3FDE|nr:hypothetical protein [Muricauda sp. SP22]MDC6364032.1 hypothetical protein [Muricauda sp. SP22]
MKLTNKNKFLIGGFFLLLIISYQLTIKKTLVLRNGYLSNNAKKELAKNIPLELSNIAQKEKQLDNQFKKLDLGSINFQNDLLKFLNETTLSNSVKMIEFNAPHTVENGTTETKTFIFILEGAFSGILKVGHSLESQINFGAITHMDFKKMKDYRTGKLSLQATIHLQLME